jgi:hypothetical protein
MGLYIICGGIKFGGYIRNGGNAPAPEFGNAPFVFGKTIPEFGNLPLNIWLGSIIGKGNGGRGGWEGENVDELGSGKDDVADVGDVVVDSDVGASDVFGFSP